jgi:exodeoxyribonuclease V alpha subunit
MRGGLERWKRGVESHGVRQAIAYALKGQCDAYRAGSEALISYADPLVDRFVVEGGGILQDRLTEAELRTWVDGCDPFTGERRGRDLTHPDSDLVLDGTVNAPKSFSLGALLVPELAVEFEALQGRLRDRVLQLWLRELNARRGAGGRVREDLARIEVVELRHRRSRALDPHIHRHLWLNVRVLGVDGKWSSVDSRVAMKFHTVVNAEGELAARTDPEWLAALARHGFSIGDDGEIRELAAAVPRFARRSAQIERHRARLLADWQQQHGGAPPDARVVRQIDRLAWALGRPNKPTTIDEDEWEDAIREELGDLQPALPHPRLPLPSNSDLHSEISDIDLLVRRTLVDADRRSAGSGGRFSRFDVRAGAIRAVAASGVVAARDDLDGLIATVVEGAMDRVVCLLEQDGTPDHVKALMAAETVAAKLDLAESAECLATPGSSYPWEVMAKLAAQLGGVKVEGAQATAAGMIAGSHRVVTVTGPAGAGKTTVLRVAHEALRRQGRGMLVVAPTRKAAAVAAREIGVNGTSVHAVLADHGWQWGRDDAGAEQWTRLRPGDTDTDGSTYPGPSRYPISDGSRIVVDEAGMIELTVAGALLELCEETGAGIALVGDPRQARPVGHSGAMAIIARRATATVELDTVHRFRDPDYGALTLRLRDVETEDDALGVAADLMQLGHVSWVAHSDAARAAMVEEYLDHSRAGRRVALVTATNDDAQQINDAIQEARLTAGELVTNHIGFGVDEQRLFVGDVVQTRRNDTSTGVQNRALWTVAKISDGDLVLQNVNDQADQCRVTADYAAEHVHLAYAATVHGIQGETTDVSIVGPGVDAAGLYVGLTRGRARNTVITIAHDQTAAVATLASTMRRGIPELTVDESRAAAASESRRAAHTSVSYEVIVQSEGIGVGMS